MSADKQLEFLRKIQRLLSEGEFTATYKFALIQALTDLSVERSVSQAHGKGLVIPLSDIAEKFIEYYWQQAIPYELNLEQTGILHQNNHRQAAVINSIVEVRNIVSGSIYMARKNIRAWKKLVQNVVRLIQKMPLWRLQVINRSVDDFIYQQDHIENGCIQLQPGVHASLRTFHGLITNLIQGCWLARIRHITANHEMLGGRADLAEFMFGSERRSLDGFRKVLREHQSAKCFYCNKQVRKEGSADHFIPWSRYPVDLGHNFVFSHTSCNNTKRDFLAHPEHLARWRESNLDMGEILGDAFDLKGLPHNLERSRLITVWAYEQGEKSRAHVWLRKNDFSLLGSSWREGIVGLRMVSEDHSSYNDK